VVDGVLEAEREAIAIYKEIITAAEGSDPVTQDLADPGSRRSRCSPTRRGTEPCLKGFSGV